MEPVLIGLGATAGLFVLILLGVHIGIALMLAGFLGVFFLLGRVDIAAGLLLTSAYSSVAEYVFAVIPLFVLMGLFAMEAGAAGQLFRSAERLLSRLRGGVGIATVGANAVFAAITGVSVASAAVFSKLAVPEMQRLRYDLKFSLGIVASSSLLGMLIPPSVLMIVYGVLAGQSVGTLFAAGVVPGLVVACALSVAIWFRAWRRPELVGLAPVPAGAGADRAAPADRPAGGGAWKDILRPWPIYLLILLVLGGIYAGLFTPTEAGAIGAFGALVLLLGSGRFTFEATRRLLLETGKSTGNIFLLLMAASLYGRMLTLSKVPTELANWLAALQIDPTFILLGFLLGLLLLGMILDSVSILLLTVPIMAPVAAALGYDPIWFGIVTIITIEIGLLTPPFGMVAFAMKASLPDSISLGDIFSGALSFLVPLFVALAVLIAFPQLTLFLPRILSG